MREKPQLRQLRVRCAHCWIFFLTDPRNRGRSDLGCPFGCAEAHRRECSRQRSRAYYQSPEGKLKKRALNARRNLAKSPEAEATPGPKERPVRSAGAVDRSAPTLVEAFPYCSSLLRYLRRMVSLIEERLVHLQEILRMVDRIFLRQRSMGRPNQFDYVVRQLHENPP